MKAIKDLRAIIAERKEVVRADQNRDSKLFLDLLDDLAQHVEALEIKADLLRLG